MKKPENPCTTLDGDDAFPDFLDPEWKKKALAELNELSAQRTKPETSQQQNEPKPSSASDVQHP